MSHGANACFNKGNGRRNKLGCDKKRRVVRKRERRGHWKQEDASKKLGNICDEFKVSSHKHDTCMSHLHDTLVGLHYMYFDHATYNKY